jgi:hypothetical protein
MLECNAHYAMRYMKRENYHEPVKSNQPSTSVHLLSSTAKQPQ